jgi:RHS repeat-associated protein
MIPAFPDEQTRIDYDLTYYVNDVNLTNTQVLAEYGCRGELKNVYTYGVQRLNAARVDGSVDTYEYDGRGSVANLVSTNAEVLASYSYDPFGEMAAGKPEQDVIFGYNGEEYNPVTGLVYLRARYYNVETGTFISEDSFLGSDENIGSQNLYAFGEGDPVNNIDPTGHFTSLITQQAGWQTDYWGNKFDRHVNGQITSQTSAINERSYNDYSISEKKANKYAGDGGDAARGLCTSYNCVPGEQVEKAIADMEQKIKDTQKSANETINGIRKGNIEEWEAEKSKIDTNGDSTSENQSGSEEQKDSLLLPLLIYKSKDETDTPEDMKFADLSKTELKKVQHISASTFWRSEESMRLYFLQIIEKFTTKDNGMAKVAKEMYYKFTNGDGGEYSSETLTDRVKKHNETTVFVEAVLKELNAIICENGGDISVLKYEEINRDTSKMVNAMKGTIFLPRFAGDKEKYNGLKITLNGLAGAKLEITSYNFNGTNYSGTLKVIFWDYFGLDQADQEKFGTWGYLATGIGFKSWYILQHYDKFEGQYKPFKTVIEFDVPFSGEV